MIVESSGVDHQTNLAAYGGFTPRYYALDHLRAWMMLFGVLFHSLCCYTTLAIPWLYKDPAADRIFDVPILLIHVFRMPIFFLLAGFFARLSFDRSGLRAFIRNRVQRILVPFLISWPVLFVVTRSTFLYLASVPLPSISQQVGIADAISKLRTLHLWFLYYLLFIYPTFLFITSGLNKYVSSERRDLIGTVVAKSFQTPWKVLIFAAPTCILLLATRMALIETDGSFLPNPVTFLSYCVFFGAGWLLYPNRIVLPTFATNAATQTLLGGAIAMIYFACLRALGSGVLRFPRTLHAIASVLGSISIWLLVFGITGLFLRYANRPNRTTRYLSDASYWIYLVHPPIIVWIAASLRELKRPASVKLPLLLILATPLLLASYQYCVRKTGIGRILGGIPKSAPPRKCLLAVPVNPIYPPSSYDGA